jgi:hypothetical protein
MCVRVLVNTDSNVCSRFSLKHEHTLLSVFTKTRTHITVSGFFLTKHEHTLLSVFIKARTHITLSVY